MKKYLLKWNLSVVFLLAGLFLFYPAHAQKTKKVVFIIVDGIPADVIEKVSHPNLQSIAAQGGYSRSYVGGIKGGYCETPTISAVEYNSLLTGTWVNKHNVWDNDIAAPNYHYYTIFRYFKQQYPDKKTAIFSSWLDNRTKLVGDHLSATGDIAVDEHYDGLELDTVNYPHDNNGDYMSSIDESVAKTASDHIRATAPDLSWVYLEYTDDMGHRYGDNPLFYQAVEKADKRIGYIWDAVQYRQKMFNEDWLVIVTTDHGRDSKTGRNHGRQSERERSSWIFTNTKDLNEEFKEPRLSIVDIAPTIVRFINLQIPPNNAFELDGMPFIGKLSLVDPVVHNISNQLEITWKSLQKKGSVKIWLATTNNFKNGGMDNYKLLSTQPVANQRVSINRENLKTSLAKLVLEGEYNIANKWIVLKEGKTPANGKSK